MHTINKNSPIIHKDQNISEAINDVDWADKTLSVRINGLDTEYWVDDILSLVDNSNERLDCIMIPKVGNSSDIYAVDALVTALEKKNGRKKKLDFEFNGYIEGNEIMKGDSNVIVTDGFTGNIALKTAEGTAKW